MRKLNNGQGRAIPAAVRWFLRLSRKDVSLLPPEESADWVSWSQQPEHLQSFQGVKRVWHGLGDVLPTMSRPSHTDLLADEYDGSVPISEWLAQRTPAGRTRSRSSPEWLRPALAAALVVVSISAAWYAYHRLASDVDEVLTYATAISEHRLVTLSDGSTMKLAPLTELSVHYTVHRRDIVLDHGEAWFSVAQRPRRPFTVLAGRGAITALGTQFDVRRDKDLLDIDRVTVTVGNGAVQVGPPPREPVPTSAHAHFEREWSPAKLVKGQEMTYDAAGPRGAVVAADLEAATAWQEGRLEYRHTPLRIVIPQVNRYSEKPIVLAAGDAHGAVGELSFSGTVFENQVRGWLQALQAAYPVQVIEGSESFTIRLRQDSSTHP